LYALSILFTINARRPARDELDEASSGGRGTVEGIPSGMTSLDRRVEGYQGSTPFGVRMGVPSLDYQGSTGGTGNSGGHASGSSEMVTPFNQEDGKAWPDIELDSLESRKENRNQRSA
jgi:hypothetical protein